MEPKELTAREYAEKAGYMNNGQGTDPCAVPGGLPLNGRELLLRKAHEMHESARQLQDLAHSIPESFPWGAREAIRKLVEAAFK